MQYFPENVQTPAGHHVWYCLQGYADSLHEAVYVPVVSDSLFPLSPESPQWWAAADHSCQPEKSSATNTRSSQASSSRGTLTSRLKSEKGSQGSKNKIGRIKAAAVKGTVTPGQICEYRKSKDAFGTLVEVIRERWEAAGREYWIQTNRGCYLTSSMQKKRLKE